MSDYPPLIHPLHSRYLYNFATAVYDALSDDFEFTDDVIVDFLVPYSDKDDRAFLATPQKYTVLHIFIKSVIGFGLERSTAKVAEESIDFYKDLLGEANIASPKWLRRGSVRNHLTELDELLLKALDNIVPSIFFLLFSDRVFLDEFQKKVRLLVKTMSKDKYPDLLSRDGILKRPNSLPVWLKSAVFYRDRGRCQECWKDLTGLLSSIKEAHIDHIIPLKQSGSNDPTNFQLLCKHCNLTKGGKPTHIKAHFIPYW